MKFKVGDIIKGTNKRYIFTDTSMYKAEVISADEDKMKIKILKHKEISQQGHEWTVDNSTKYFALIKNKKFEKSGLKSGDIVTYKNGEKRFLCGEILINKYGKPCSCIETYSNDLKSKTGNERLDIVKVERPLKYEMVFKLKKEILDEVERRYLANFIRPFRNKIKYIVKFQNPLRKEKEYLRIVLGTDERINLPDFDENCMYKKMEEYKEYTLKELGL